MLGTGLGCTAAEPGSPTAAATVPHPSGSAPAPAPASQPHGSPRDVPSPHVPASLRGEVVVRQDVEGLPDLPLWDGSLVVVPAQDAGLLWASAGMDPPPELGILHGEVPDDAVADAGGTVLEVDDGGGFRADLAAGDYLLCLRAFGPTALAGCDVVTVPARVSIATGRVPFRLAVVDA